MASIDAMLVNLTLQGDQNAFARLMERHRPGLLNLALSQVGNLSEAEDIIQEAFIQAYQHLATLQDRDKFPGWMYRIARNLCYAALRKRRLTFDSLDAPNAVEVAGESMGPDALIEGRELSESIVKAVATLPDKNQSVFLLYLEGWSYRDIATTYHLSTSTVLGRIQRSKQHVKERVSKDGYFAASPGP
ncbi:RNA polymerase sigma factor, partial [Candidatus Poribacteria bacterium]|nr:RNA polymerase sigma factor [Candidatus Poribacteria bacterium]